MVIGLRHRWLAVGSGLALGAGIVVWGNGPASGLGVAAAICLLWGLVAFRMRVVADSAGLKVVNLGWTKRIRWEEISGFSLQSVGWWATGGSLEIRLKDGKRVRGWALATTSTGYPLWAVEKMLGELRRRLAEANGETTDEADARALDEAVRSAESGDYAPFWDLVGDDRIPPETLWGGVDALAARGRLDRDALERSGPKWARPKISRSMRRRLVRMHPELARELDEDGR